LAFIGLLFLQLPCLDSQTMFNIKENTNLFTMEKLGNAPDIGFLGRCWKLAFALPRYLFFNRIDL